MNDLVEHICSFFSVPPCAEFVEAGFIEKRQLGLCSQHKACFIISALAALKAGSGKRTGQGTMYLSNTSTLACTLSRNVQNWEQKMSTLEGNPTILPKMVSIRLRVRHSKTACGNRLLCCAISMVENLAVEPLRVI